MISNYSENFVKLKSNCIIGQYSCAELKKSHGIFNQQNQWKGIKYYDAYSKVSDKLWNLIPCRFHDDFKLRIMTINCHIPPHTDSNILCSINAYIKSDGSTTKFYSIIGDTITRKITNQTNGSIFDNACLTQLGEFIAAQGEVYLLDVTVPHSVEPIDNESGTERIAVCLQSKTKTFGQVLDMLKLE